MGSQGWVLCWVTELHEAGALWAWGFLPLVLRSFLAWHIEGLGKIYFSRSPFGQMNR